MGLEGKKLLVLGGTSYYPYISEYAKKRGYKIYSAGKSDNESIRLYSDRFFAEDAIDIDAISSLVQREDIDGIVALGNEDIISCVIDISSRCQLPFYINREHWENLQNKKVFKEHCKEFDIDIVEEYSVTESSGEHDLYSLPYPIVLKPSDGCGSKGVTVCYDASCVKRAMQKAKSFSRSGQFIAEQYMTCPEFIVSYIINNGEVRVWMLGDRHMNIQQKEYGGISQMSVFPSRHSDLYMEQVHPKMLKLLEKYGPRNGTFFAQAFIDGERIRFFDPGLRFCGTLDIILYERLCGINPLHWMINHSLTGIMDDTGEMTLMDVALGGKLAVQLSLHVRTGIIEKIIGLDQVTNINGVISLVSLLQQGDSVDMEGTLQQVLARVYIIAEQRSEIMRIVENIYDIVSVISTEGENMLMPFVLDFNL